MSSAAALAAPPEPYLVKDINPGGDGSSPSNLTDVGDTLYFSATDPTNGEDLWALNTDTTPPDTTIATGPVGTITTNQATFTFAGNPAEDTAKVQFWIDGEPYADCASPKTFTGLSDGSHTASFRAEDATGNQDPTPVTRIFTVDTSVDPTVDPPVGKAEIGTVKVKGPAKVKKGKKVTYRVKTSNTGNAEATDVRLKISGKGVSFRRSAGSIAAATTKTIKLELKPKKSGKVKIAFKVTSENAGGKTVKKKIEIRK